MLTSFAPKPGINSDDTTFAAEGRWADGSNVRFWNGQPQVVGGWVTQFTIAVGNGTCKSILAFDRSGTLTLAYGLTGALTKLYVGTGLAAPTSRTPAGLTNLEIGWSLAAWGSTLLACPVGGTLYEQTGTSTATAVAAAPDAISHMLVTQQRQVLAFGCNEEISGTFNSRCIRGSNLEDYTNWTTTSTNNAFEHILDGVGEIVTAREIGSYVAVWTTSALYLGQFIGDPSQTYRFDKVDDNCGIVGQNAVAILNGTAYWMAPDLQVRAWSPGGLPQIVPCPISKDFTAHIGASAYVYVTATTVSRYGEVWFFYADDRGGSGGAGAGINNRYIALSTRDGGWFKGLGGRTAALDSGVLSGVVVDAGQIVAANGSGDFDIQEYGKVGTLNAPLVWFLTSADVSLDNSNRRVMIRGVRPDFEDQAGDVSLTLFVRDHPQSTAVTKGPYTLTTATVKKDFRASGKLVSIKYSGTDGALHATSTYMRLGKPLFDTVAMGER